MSVSDQIDMSALQSHHSDHCFQRMRLMTAYGTEFFSMNDVNRLRILQDVIDHRLTTRLAAPGLRYLTDTADGCWRAIVNMGRFHLLTVVVASLATGNSCRDSLNEHYVLSANATLILARLLPVRSSPRFMGCIWPKRRYAS